MDDKSLIVTSAALWQLHEDVLHFFEEVNYLVQWSKLYPFDSPGFFEWSEAHELVSEEWTTKYPDATGCEARARKALESISTLVELTDSISQRRPLFFWFARAYIDWPSYWGVEGRGNASRHEDAFAASDAYLSELLENYLISKYDTGQPADLENLVSIVEAIRHYSPGVLFLYADEVPVGLRHEAALAVKLSETAAPQSLLQKSSPPVSASADIQATEFVPTTLQAEILDALHGRALKKDALANAVCDSNSSRLYKKSKHGKSPLGELKELGLVANKHGLGYYRPDAPPPPTAVNQVPRSGPK